MIRKVSLLLAASAIVFAAPVVPAYAKADKSNNGNGNGNGNNGGGNSGGGNGGGNNGGGNNGGGNNGGGNGNGGGNTPAPAPAPAPTPTDCNAASGTVFASATFSACSGFYAGNAISGGNNAADIAILNQGLSDLGSSYTGSWLVKVENGTTPLVGGLIDFGQTLYGETIVGLHFGNIDIGQTIVPLTAGNGNPENVTLFVKFDFGTAGANGVQLLNTRGFSNAALFSTGMAAVVPEPETWALLILGFGLVGAGMRRKVTRIAFA